MAELMLSSDQAMQDLLNKTLGHLKVGKSAEVMVNGKPGMARLFCTERQVVGVNITACFRLMMHGVLTVELKAVCEDGIWRVA